MHDKYIGKVLIVQLPNNVRPRFRWIVRKIHDGDTLLDHLTLVY